MAALTSTLEQRQYDVMPKKIRELSPVLERAGLRRKPRKGSHRKYVHADGRQLVLSGNDGDDAKPYQEKQVRKLVRD